MHQPIDTVENEAPKTFIFRVKGGALRLRKLIIKSSGPKPTRRRNWRYRNPQHTEIGGWRTVPGLRHLAQSQQR